MFITSEYVHITTRVKRLKGSEVCVAHLN